MIKIKPVTFEPIEHKYTLTGTDKRLISVSQIIHRFTNEFDPLGKITANYAKKHGMTIQEVEAEWKRINVESCE